MSTSDAVSIRFCTQNDADHIVEAVRESVAEISPWMVWCRPDYSHEHARSWILESEAQRGQRLSYEFGVFDEAGMFLGVCGVNHVNLVDRFANLGYWIRTSRTGQGVASSAVRAVAAWTFANTNLTRLEIVAAVGNHRSQRVAERVGALREGVMRNRLIVGGMPTEAVMYSLVP